MNKELQTVLPEFGKAIRPHLYNYVTANKHATAKHVVFMAGSPAAGKTELLNRLIEQHGMTNIVRIDADDFRWWFPYYNEENSVDYQRYASSMVEFIYKKTLEDGYPIVMDSTFSSTDIAERNFDRALKAGYQVMLNYVYFDPTLAWVYAKSRARRVPLDILKANFFKSRETIEHMLKRYAGQFTLNVYHRRADPDNEGQFLVDITTDVTLETWSSSHHCPYTRISDLAHIGV